MVFVERGTVVHVDPDDVEVREKLFDESIWRRWRKLATIFVSSLGPYEKREL